MKNKEKKRLSLDVNNMMKKSIGRSGVSDEDITRLKPKLKKALNNIKQKRDDGKLGFMYLPYDNKTGDEIKLSAGRVRAKFENLVVLGIGGSALGAIAVHRALKHPYYNMLSQEKRKAPRLFVLDNPDPEVAEGIFDVIDIKKTAVNIISKSGSTAETAAFFKIFWNKVKKSVKSSKFREHFIITTDEKTGALRKIVEKYKFESFSVPGNVGGRFSVLSPAGLFPLACTGVDIDGLLSGAAVMDNLTASDNPWKNPALMRAAMHYHCDIKTGRKITVMLPYSSALKDMADWFAQLWAESLGKKYSNDGKIVNIGLTPIKALGATDQHSQVQLYAEGPHDKVFTFVKVRNCEK